MIREIPKEELEAMRASDDPEVQRTFRPRAKWSYPRKLSNVEFVDKDFGSPFFGGFFWRPKFDNCRFVKCDWGGSIIRYAAFVDCIFDQTALDGPTWGGPYKSTFQRSVFRACPWGQGFAPAKCVFVDCQFLDMNFDDTVFRRCTLENCTFTGTFKDVRWIRCKTKKVDVSSVKMKDSSLFISSNEYDIKLPDNDQNFLALPVDYEQAREAVKRQVSGEAHAHYVWHIKHWVHGDTLGEIIDYGMFMHTGDVSETEAKIITACLRETVLARRHAQ